MKKILLFLLSFIFSVPVYSNWIPQTSGTTNTLLGVSFADASTGTAVGNAGIILRTTNGGVNWTSQSGPPVNLTGVSFTDADNGTVVGEFGIILKTTNGGINWTSQSVVNNLLGVSFTDADNGTVVGLGGTIGRTTNGGTNWTPQSSGTGSYLRGVSFTDANNGTAVGAAGIILRTTNGGTNWTSQSSETGNYLHGVSFIDANTGTAVGGSGTILRTTNGGTNWTSQSSGVPNSLEGVSFTDANNGTVIGAGGIILRTTNGGTNWTSQFSGTTSDLWSVSFTEPNTGTAAGAGGILLHYVNPNFGNNEQAGNNLYYFANSSIGASGAPSKPTFDWRDTTGSTSLIVNGTNVSTLGAGSADDGRYDIIAQLPPGNSIRFFGTDYSNFYIGTNGITGFTAFAPGNTWDIGNASITGLPQNYIPTMSTAVFPLWVDMNFEDTNVPVNRLSYKITSNEVIITYDRAPLYNPAAEANQYVTFQVIISHSASPTQNSKVIVQFDDAASGSTFINQYNTNTLPPHIAGLQGSNSISQVLQYRYMNNTTLTTEGPLFSSPLAVAYGPDDTVLPVELASFTASVDRRDVHLNWTTVNEMNNSGFDVERRAEGSANGGETWSKTGSIQGSGTTIEAKNYSYTDKGLNTGKYSYRLKQVDYNGNYEYYNLSGEIIIGVPQKYDLGQNYPNPFNPVTKINFEIPAESLTKLLVYDMSGREVAILINQVMTPGYYAAEFNGSSMASGVYFYRLVSGNTVITKKMTLIK